MIVQGKALWAALFTRSQQRALGLLYGHPQRSFYANEIVRRSNGGTGAMQRELTRLAAAGVLTVTRVGNQKHYQANSECPIFHELRALVTKTFGAVDSLRGALQSLGGEVQCAFLFGPGAETLAAPGAPLDLLIVSDELQRAAIAKPLKEAGESIGREIRLVLLGTKRYREMESGRDPRLQQVLEQHRVMLVGRTPS